MNLLFYDLEITGHHTEYINHLINYIVEAKRDIMYTFIVHPEFTNLFPVIVKKANDTSNIRFVEVTQSEYRRISSKKSIAHSFMSYNLMNKYAINQNAQVVHLMVLNIFQLPLLFFRPNYQIKGILFQPFVRMDRKALKSRIRYYRKIMQTWLFTRNKKIERIFVLNDKEIVDFLNKKFKTSIYQILPDPVPELNPLLGFSVRNTFKIKSNRKIFLHFGSLSERKGTLEILDSFIHMKRGNISKMALLLIGKATLITDQEIQKRITLIEQKFNEVLIVYRNEFVSDSMMKSYFNQCDFVLIPYKNVEASSGVLGHAISAGKPVLATDSGLLGSLVSKNKLGILLNNYNSIEIASKIEYVLTNHIPKIENQQYIKKHTPTYFVKTFID